MSEERLAYFKAMVWASGAYAGGLMIVDSAGLPLDFRYTEPITPTRLQEVLYGRSLDRFMRAEVLFRHLCTRIEPRPTLVLVDDEGLLSQPAASAVVYVAETRLPPFSAAAELHDVNECEWLLQVTEAGSPLRFKLHEPQAGDEEAVATWFLTAAAAGLDPLEPFNRVRAALELACAPAATPTAPSVLPIVRDTGGNQG
ncbi:MAG: hypothetical protein VKQ33_04000 [Candidatus Sericytochromatia bacterium]|nr:hypothetical protein [Candidatus Sericytochromatia bacterium]